MSFVLRMSNGQETAVTGTLRIGRAPECEIQIADSLASRVHASVWVEDGQLLVRDQRSSNGTFLNGRPLPRGAPSVLRPGDLLRIGDTTFSIAVGAGQAAPPQPRPPAGGPADGPPRVPARAASSAPPSPAAMPLAATQVQARPWRALGLGAGILALGAVAIVLLAGTVGIAVFLLRRPAAAIPPTSVPAGQTSVPPGQTPSPGTVPTTFEKQDVTLAKPDGVAVSDTHGVSLTAPTGSLDTGVAIQMTAYKMSGTLAQALSDQYDLKLPFYSITAQGQNGSTRNLTLSFPAPSAQSRVLVVIDRKYMGVLDVLPDNGKLTVTALAVPEDTQGLKPGTATGRGDNIAYTVITRKAGSSAVSPALVHPASRTRAGSGQDCNPVIQSSEGKPGTAGVNCRKNAAGTLWVMPSTALGITLDQADNVVQAVESRMSLYAAAGFTAAKLSPASPLMVIIAEPSGDPQYSSKTGVIYVPSDVAQDITGKGKLITHEIGHWIQGRAYHMYADAIYGGYKEWWLEISAEDMVMLINPDYIKQDMDFYGPVNANDYDLVFQYSPYQYPYVMYVQSQLVMVNMCDNPACPISKTGFVNAINTGTFPFNDDHAKLLVDQNTQDYATYLVGKAPRHANSAIPLTAVQSQGTYGQNVTIRDFKGNLFTLQHNGTTPQMDKQSKNGMDSLVIKAALQKDGVYPLEITTGDQGKFPGLPAMLTVSAGTPFVYRLDGGDPVYSDGSQDVVLGPIHPKLGIGSVRLVAYSATGNQTFKARVDLVDLTGAWVIQRGSLVSNNVKCTGGGGVSGTDQLLPLFPAVSELLTGMGAMLPDTNGPKLSWSLVPARLPATTKASDFSYTASAEIRADSVELTSNTILPVKKSGSVPGLTGAVSLAMLAILPGIQIARGQLRQKRLAVVLLPIVSALLLAGCVGLDVNGTVGSQVKFTGLKYEGGIQKVTWTYGQPIAGKPVWAFTQGTATYQINMLFTVSASSPDSTQAQKQPVTCAGPMVYDVTGGVYQDVDIIIPKNTGK